MGRWLLGAASCAGAVFWLALLEMTGFSIVAVSAGLLAFLILTGRSSRP
jgi:hypothetical protein